MMDFVFCISFLCGAQLKICLMTEVRHIQLLNSQVGNTFRFMLYEKTSCVAVLDDITANDALSYRNVLITPAIHTRTCLELSGKGQEGAVGKREQRIFSLIFCARSGSFFLLSVMFCTF